MKYTNKPNYIRYYLAISKQITFSLPTVEKLSIIICLTKVFETFRNISMPGQTFQGSFGLPGRTFRMEKKLHFNFNVEYSSFCLEWIGQVFRKLENDWLQVNVLLCSGEVCFSELLFKTLQFENCKFYLRTFFPVDLDLVVGFYHSISLFTPSLKAHTMLKNTYLNSLWSGKLFEICVACLRSKIDIINISQLYDFSFKFNRIRTCDES